MSLSDMLIAKQAMIYHDELKIKKGCEYSTGWLQKFKKRCSVRFLKIYDDEAYSDGKEIHSSQYRNFNRFFKSISVHSLINNKIAKIVLNLHDCLNSDDKDGTANTAENVHILDVVECVIGVLKD